MIQLVHSPAQRVYEFVRCWMRSRTHEMARRVRWMRRRRVANAWLGCVSSSAGDLRGSAPPQKTYPRRLHGGRLEPLVLSALCYCRFVLAFIQIDVSITELCTRKGVYRLEHKALFPKPTTRASPSLHGPALSCRRACGAAVLIPAHACTSTATPHRRPLDHKRPAGVSHCGPPCGDYRTGTRASLRHIASCSLE